MTTVASILKCKCCCLSTVPPTASVHDILCLFSETKTSAVIVSTDGVHLDGIISERDIIQSIRAYGAGAFTQTIEALMTKDVTTCSETDPIAGVMAIMNDQKTRHMPVLNTDAELVGMITKHDIIHLRLKMVLN